ncbi:LolA family protein [Herpetosiphon llansteffanensis]
MHNDNNIAKALANVAEHEVPEGSLNLLKPLQQQATLKPQTRRTGWLRPAMMAATGVALAAVGFGLLPSQVSQVSAKEALRRAEQVTAFGLNNIESLHGVLETHVPATGSVVSEKIWVQQPNKLRKEIVWPGSETRDEQYETQIMNGADAWAWISPAGQPNTVDGTVSQFSSSELDGALYVIPNPTASLDSNGNSEGLCAQPGDQLSTVGQESFLGRDALVIECVIGGDSDQANTRLKFWIDDELFVVLKSEYYEANGDIFVESAYTEFEVNGSYPADFFAPPAGAPIEVTQ